MPSISELLTRLRHYVRAESETQFEALDKQWSAPLQERVSKGWAIEGLELVHKNKHILQFKCGTNDSRFREGDLLVLHRGNPKDPNALHVDLMYDNETELEFTLIQGNSFFLDADPGGWIADQDWFDPRQFYLSALDQAGDSLRGRSIILPLLMGSLTPRTDYARFERTTQTLANAGLNDSQVEAVAQAYASDLLHLIQGPPGTGKTLMLAHLAKLLVEDGQRVFVTALTHRAIHNALNKIHEVDPDLPACKIGESRHTGDLKVDSFENFDQSRYDQLRGGYVIGATPFSTQTKRLANVEFDVVLFDEASQITLPLAIMGMLAGNKFIFIGDDNQLPPVTVLSDQDARQTSIFAYLTGRGNQSMLNITYRLNDILVDWPNKTFYNQELRSSPDASKRRLKLLGSNSRWDFVLDPSSPAIFLDICTRNTTVRSRREAETIVELIKALLDHQIAPEEIGVVVPYRAQSRLIRTLLRRALDNTDTFAQIAVDTVERMQGQQKEVILVSFTTSSPTFSAQMADFLFQPQRLNVAVTRPKTKLILVGSHHMLDAGDYDPETAEKIALVKSLIDNCLHLTVPDGILD
jgi:DNA replication ATP-dependent helicase Dna2